ncbi:MAG: hypothetical protein M3R53_03580 [Candidatus Eremiobacteraeota bacterium]|nr:hypothetical protein [Candidatus Eremiobacteraeota bacterium]
MNPVLRAVDAAFARDGTQFVAPFTLTVASAETCELPQPNARAASIAARMCAAIVKPTGGTIFVGEYETRLQPPQAKRQVGFVDADGFVGDAHAFKCDVAFRAEVWDVEYAAARARAERVLEELGEGGAYARAVALALVADVALIVLDRPPAAILLRVRDIAPGAAIVFSSEPVVFAPERALSGAAP